MRGRRLAGPPARRVGGDPRHAAALDPDRGQGPDGVDPAGEPLVERAALRYGAGLTTSLIPRGERAFQIDFDFIDHQLDDRRVGRRAASMALEPRTVADFYAELMALLDDLGLAHRRSGRCRSRSPTRSPSTPTRALDLRRRPGPSVLAGARPDGSGLRGVPQPVRRQGQPGPPVLGRARPRRHPVLRPPGPTAPGRRAELRTPRHARGLLARGEQRRLLAGADGEGIFYSYAYPEPDGFAVADLDVAGRPLRRRSSASSSSRTRQCARPSIPTSCCCRSSRPPTRPPPTSPAGTGTRSSGNTEPPGDAGASSSSGEELVGELPERVLCLAQGASAGGGGPIGGVERGRRRPGGGRSGVLPPPCGGVSGRGSRGRCGSRGGRALRPSKRRGRPRWWRGGGCAAGRLLAETPARGQASSGSPISDIDIGFRCC